MSDSAHGIGGLKYDPKKKARPQELNVFIALAIIVVAFEGLGRILYGDSFLFNTRDNVDAIFNWARLNIIILQVSIVGIIALGVTQVIISGGIDLSSGSIVGATAMIVMSFAQTELVNGNPNPKAIFGPWASRSSVRPSCNCCLHPHVAERKRGFHVRTSDTSP